MSAMRDLDLDNILPAWFEAEARVREPEGLLPAVLATTAVTRRRPAWRIPERWIPMLTTMRAAPAPRLALYITALLTLALLLAFAIYVAGQRNLPSPLGPARNGVITFDSNGTVVLANADGTNRVPLTKEPEWTRGPTWSPDGTHLAYISQVVEGNVWSIVVNSADGSNPTTVATDVVPSGATFVLAWSPDSKWLAFPAYSKGDRIGHIDVIAANGSGSRTIVPDGIDPAWSPDGHSLAYVNMGDKSGVWLVNADGSNNHQLSHATGTGNAFRNVNWTPNGTALVFQAMAFGENDIVLAQADGSGERELVRAHAASWPVVNPDGTEIAYLTSAEEGVSVNTIGLNGTAIGSTVVPQLQLHPIEWSPDGTRVIGHGVSLLAPAYGQNPNEVLVIDPTGTVPPVAIPAEGNTGLSNWQRLAP